ncbi:hypothetical protein E8E13_009159 [Curvularia kusanoi]|uniref:Uncharacterized protein n=1 Tax=Curvularia kusanoi TaxID=90978 RepID=A0A9P4TH53_CURKU|nr:hypothetical protein E8E13_009159 [Curvularia kusanoi]
MSNNGSFNQNSRYSSSSADLQIRKNRLAALQKKLNDLVSERAQLDKKIARVTQDIQEIKEFKGKTTQSEKRIVDTEGGGISEETLVVRGNRRFGQGKGGYHNVGGRGGTTP